jgi:hypothetical protein
MGFGIVIQKLEVDNKSNLFERIKLFVFKVSFADEDQSNSDTDDSDFDSEEENNIPSPILSSTIEFPSLFNDKNLNIRNAYVNKQYICSEFILMIEHKETIAISCFTKKITKPISGIKFKFSKKIETFHFLVSIDPNVFHINNQEELYLQYVACAFSIHKIYIIDISEDEQCKIPNISFFFFS